MELRREVETLWAATPSAERQGIAAEVLGLLDWARQMTLAGRSHTQRKLAEVRREGAYVQARRDRLPIEFEG